VQGKWQVLLLLLLLLTTGCRQDEELITVDVFAYQANYQGIQGGWFGKYVEDKFKIRLNIIAPNVSSGENLYQTRFASAT